MLIRLSRTQVTIAGADALAAARAFFQANRHLPLPGFFGPDLLEIVQRQLRIAPFKTRVANLVDPPAVDLKLDDALLQGSLRWLLNEQSVRHAIRGVTGIQSEAFGGGVYRIAAGQGHLDSWHDDLDGRRSVGITINLTEGVFEGGELQMREKGSEDLLWRFANTGAGDGLLFAIGESLEHCIAPMKGSIPKTALAGWFSPR